LNNTNLNALFAASSPPPPATTAGHNILEGLVSPTSQPVTSSSNNLDDIFGDFGGSLTSTTAGSFAPPMTVYDKNDFRIVFDFEKSGVPNQVSNVNKHVFSVTDCGAK
jgi:hypothetical protein